MQAVSAACRTSTELADVVSGRAAALYLPDPGAMRAADAYSWGFVPPGTQSILLLNTKPFGLQAEGTAGGEASDANNLHESSSASSCGFVTSGSNALATGELNTRHSILTEL